MLAPSRPVPAPAPVSSLPAAGDSWTYRYVDGWRKDSPQTVVVRVVESDEARVTDRMSMRGGRGADERTLEGKVQASERALGSDVRVIELLPYLQGLLQDGIKPGQEISLADLALGGQTYRIRARLVGQEKLTVPAGTFEASKLEVLGQRMSHWQGSPGGDSRIPKTFSHTVWFVPEVRRVVKAEHKSIASTGSRVEDDTLELLSYEGSGQRSAPVAAAPADRTLPLPAADVVAALPKSGDSWSYRYVDAWKKDSPQALTVKVDESEGGRVTDRMSMRGGRGSDERTFDGKLQGNERGLGGDVRVIELLPYLQNLLQEGIKPGEERALADLALGGQTYRVRLRLVGRETLAVPAGSFEASKFEVLGQRMSHWQGSPGGDSRIPKTFTHSVWFVPEVRRVVKVEHKSMASTGSRVEDDTLELVSFALR
jgi:hypothetical protein